MQDFEKMVRVKMAENNINSVAALAEASGVDYQVIGRAFKNVGSAKLVNINAILKPLKMEMQAVLF